MMQEQPDTKLQEIATQAVKDYLKSGGYTDRKLTDMPTDDLQVVPRKYVNLNGATLLRPTAPSQGQYYFDTDLGKPVWFNGTTWVLATGVPA